MKAVITVLTVLFILAVGLTGWAIYDDHKTLLEFCNDNGYTHAQMETWKWEDSMCVNMSNNIKTEKIVDTCRNKWCFVIRDNGE